MKHWVRLASYLYPATWRRRYAAEFDAMLDQVDPDWHDVFDTLRGAITMRFTSWNLKTITLTFAAIGVVIAAAIAFSIPSEYQSTSVMRAMPQQAQYLNRVEQEILSRTSLEKLIVALDLYKKQRAEMPFEEIVQHMRTHDISIRMIRMPRGQSLTAFSISYVYPDPRLAQAVTQDLVTQFSKQNVVDLELLDPPSWPLQPLSPHRAPLILTGLFAGLLLGLTVSYAMRWRIMIVRRPAH